MITIDVKGKPVGQGAVRYNTSGHGYHANQKLLKPWRDMIKAAVMEAWGGAAPWIGGVEVQATFCFEHLKSHRKANGVLRDDAPLIKTTAPDLDHLQRAVGDALKDAGAILSDAQICSWTASKAYSEQPGLHLVIRKL